ncbi:HD domain-containing phosphohydrolase [Pelosinus propionicus]|uniref:HD domain-containing protein n=1 Tax=Pelosinus propionicus DSM 13327 TaxID=1123291 RepID=A0A1I4HMX4_9FIRM|nr:HD domain-containing phosphohydrolase [Pelosinus propionicus]SFL43110.1 HD domain-containing protein [Pelosinus propionicus DSM 13327]
MVYNIHPINLFRALSLSLELSNGGLSHHHWRTAMISSRIGRSMNMMESQHEILVYTALLHDLGAASSWDERVKLRTFEVEDTIYDHAEVGYRLLKDSPILGVLAVYIRHHHDFYDGSSPSGLMGSEIPLISRIINVADRLDVLIDEEKYILGQKGSILSRLESLGGIYFDPEVIAALQTCSQQESFWLDLADTTYAQRFFDNVNQYGYTRFNVDDILDIAEIFAKIIDQTSSFTGAHSRNVAMISSFLAGLEGYSEEECKAIQIAGLLHDLGKLAVPKQLLEKTEKLVPREFDIIKQHAYYTYRILEQIDEFEVIAEWAAYHHETLDGRGYPFRMQEDRLKMGSRIVAVADIFAALTEDRSYRSLLSPSEVKKIMYSMVRHNKIDKKIVKNLFKNLDCVNHLVQTKIHT